jgi:hypothetical protein
VGKFLKFVTVASPIHVQQQLNGMDSFVVSFVTGIFGDYHFTYSYTIGEIIRVISPFTNHRPHIFV